MKHKIVQLMKSEGLTSSRLADILETQPSGISHLVSGRNKPSFDLLQKILRRFPRINPYWLMLDSEDMYLPEESQSPPLVDQPHNNTPSHEPHGVAGVGDLFTPAVESPSPHTPASYGESVHSPGSSKIDLNPQRVKRVILLYEDGSCESYMTK